MMKSRFRNFFVYKPYGMLSQFTSEGSKPGLGSLCNFPKDCYPIGRLDSDSEGLLLLSNDASLNKKLLDPVNGHKRTYFAQVEGVITEEAMRQLREGVTIRVEGKMHHTRPALAEKIASPSMPPRIPPIRTRKNIPTSWISLTLTEGKNRQVRHMTAAVGFPTLRLVRIRIEEIDLGNMQPGDVQEIESEELFRKLKIRSSL